MFVCMPLYRRRCDQDIDVVVCVTVAGVAPSDELGRRSATLVKTRDQ